MKKKRTKKYNPNKHQVNHNSVYTAIKLSRPITDSAKNELVVATHLAIDAFTRGVAEKTHFDILAATVDACEIMRVNFFEGAYDVEINAARVGMLRCKERFYKTDKLGLDGEAFNAVKELAIIHEDMLNHVTGFEYLNLMKKRHENIVSGNVYKGTAADIARASA